MSAGVEMTWEQGNKVARHLVQLLSGSCERIMVAGSLRRGAPVVHDIELLAQPRMVSEPTPGDLFGTPRRVSDLDRRLGELMAIGELALHPKDPKNGPRYKKLVTPVHFFSPGLDSKDDGAAFPRAYVQVDLFIVKPPASWGAAVAIRTGPGVFSKMLVTKLRDFNRRCEDLRVVQADGTPIDCPTEEEFFRLCGMPYLQPSQRGDA